MEQELVRTECTYSENIMFLKVHLGCCNACPRKAKIKLSNLPGVCGVSIDVENDLVTVYGDVSLEALTEELAKMGRKAEIYHQTSDFQQTCHGAGTKSNRSVEDANQCLNKRPLVNIPISEVTQKSAPATSLTQGKKNKLSFSLRILFRGGSRLRLRISRGNRKGKSGPPPPLPPPFCGFCLSGPPPTEH